MTAVIGRIIDLLVSTGERVYDLWAHGLKAGRAVTPPDPLATTTATSAAGTTTRNDGATSTPTAGTSTAAGRPVCTGTPVPRANACGDATSPTK